MVVRVADTGERWRSLSPLFPTVGKLPSTFLSTHCYCPGSHLVQIHWYSRKLFSDTDACEDFPAAPGQLFLHLSGSHMFSFAGQVENEGKSSCLKELCVSSWSTYYGTSLAAAGCLQTGLGRCNWAGVGPGWKNPSGALEVGVLSIVPDVDRGAAAPSQFPCDPLDLVISKGKTSLKYPSYLARLC